MRTFLLIACMLSTVAHGGEMIKLATTTSTENSGLVQYLLPDFEEICRCQVHVVVAASGKALAFGRQGDVDVLLTHFPAEEKKFVAAGFGVSRRPVMYNDFVIVGPPDDPAGLAKQHNITALLQKLVAAKTAFISRGDNSGTHNKERALWRLGGKPPADKYYIETGASMGQTLLMADELRAYTLSDRGTFLAFKDKIRARIVSPPTPAPIMKNVYSVIVINPQKHPHINGALAQKFADWLISPKTQDKIGTYRQHGEALFFPYTAHE